MGIIKNWKAQRAERIEAAKAREARKAIDSGQKVVMDTNKVDPRAKEFLDYTSALLEEHGITNKERRDRCCYDLFETMQKSFNLNALSPGKSQDEYLMKMAGCIADAGIQNEDIQEDIILKFLVKFKKIGGF